MMNAAKTCLEYLDAKDSVQPVDMEKHRSVMEELIQAVRQDGIRDDQFRENFEAIQHKALGELTLKEVYTYLTHLVIRDRCWGTLETSIEDGTLRILLKRYLELAQ